MAKEPVYVVQSYRRQKGELTRGDAFEGSSEDAVFRRGRAMQARVAGLVFYKIATSAEGDVWSEVELLAKTGDVPSEAA